jgi:hypothetical protein
LPLFYIASRRRSAISQDYVYKPSISPSPYTHIGSGLTSQRWRTRRTRRTDGPIRSNQPNPSLQYPRKHTETEDQVRIGLPSPPALISIVFEIEPEGKFGEQSQKGKGEIKEQLTRTRISIGRFGRTPLGGRQVSTVHLDDPDGGAVGCTEEVVPFGLQNHYSRRDKTRWGGNTGR